MTLETLWYEEAAEIDFRAFELLSRQVFAHTHLEAWHTETTAPTRDIIGQLPPGVWLRGSHAEEIAKLGNHVFRRYVVLVYSEAHNKTIAVEEHGYEWPLQELLTKIYMLA